MAFSKGDPSMKKVVSSLLMASLLFGGISVVSAEGEAKQAVKATKEEKAAKWGVDPTGKTNKEVKEAIQAAKDEKREENLAKWTAKAAEHQIDSAGKTVKQLKAEIQASKAEKKAAKKAEKKNNE